MMWNADGCMGLGWMPMILFWVVVIAGVVVAVRWWAPTRQNDRSLGSETALDILEKRYARGEIDQAEYEQKRQDLMR